MVKVKGRKLDSQLHKSFIVAIFVSNENWKMS
jgi:hypothetical protein